MKKLLTLLFLSAGLFGLQAQCLSVNNFLGTNVSSNSIDIDFSGSGNGPMEIEYGVFGFVIGNGTRITTNNRVHTLSNLAPATRYRVFVRRVCGNQTSFWNSFSFTTSCGSSVSPPLLYKFDGSAWQYTSFPTTPGTMDTCWMVSPQGSSSFWNVGPPYDSRVNSGPAQDHTTGRGGYLTFDSESTSQDTLSRLQSPAINLLGLNHPQMEFWYHLYGADIDSLELMARYATNGDWDTLHTFVGEQQFSQHEDWKKLSLSLSAYRDSIIYVQFAAYGGGTAVHMSIDDLSFHDSLDCRPSTNFRAVSTDENSALMDWDDGTGSSFTIEYGLKGFSLGSGTQVSVSAPPYRITGLSSASSYDFYIRNECGMAGASPWSSKAQANTDCTPILAPHFEDFEGSAWPIGGMESCWDRYDFDDFQWNVGPPALSYTQSGPGYNNHTPGGSRFIVAHRGNLAGHPRSSITTPLFDLDSIANPELKFWTHMFGLHITAFEVAIDSGDGFAVIKQIIGGQQLSKIAPWSEQIISLPQYSGKKVKIKFTTIASSTWSSLARVALDDFSIGEAPACPKPTNLAVRDLKFRDGSFDWSSGGANHWMYKLQVNGGMTTISSTSSNPLHLSQLFPGTEYTLWVRDSCGLGNSSEWSAPLEFKTFCLPDTAPIFEDFENSQFVVQTSWFSTGTLHPCWSRSHEIGPIWQPSPATIFPNNLLPTADHTTGSGKYMGGDLFLGNGSNEPTSFTTPYIDISPLGRPELAYWYFLGGYSWSANELKVEINNGSGWQNIGSIQGPTHLSTSSNWTADTINLLPYRGDTIRLRFSSLGNNLYAATAGAIDDISIHHNPNCLAPSDLKTVFVGSTEAKLAWNTGGSDDWIIKHRQVGQSFQYRSTSSNDPFTLGNLLPATTYEFWVRDSCGSDVSPWIGPLFFTTECLPYTVPYYESFDGTAWTANGSTSAGIIDPCWRRSDAQHKAWIPNSGASGSTASGPNGSRSGSANYMMTQVLVNPGQSPGPPELRSPLIINSGLTQPELNFWYHLYGPQIQKLLVYLEFLDDSRLLIDSIIGQQQSNGNAAWLQRTIDLSAFLGDTFKIVFKARVGNTQGNMNLAIDDVEIINASCSDPANLGATNITFSSASLFWTSISPHSSLEYDLAGFNLGSGTRLSSVSSAYPLNGLAPFTTYEFYVQDSCRLNSSNWAGPYAFTTDCSQPLASFSQTSTTLTVNFDASASQGTNLNYLWDFGDGNSSNGVAPSHSYASGGTYTVQLISTDTCGYADTISQNITVCDIPQAVINYTVNGLQVHFSGLSSTGANQYRWTIDSLGVFTSDSFSLSFPSRGNYQVLLVVTNACGDQDSLLLNLVLCDQPTASYTRSISAFNNVLVVNFDGTASTHVDSFLWKFGDGNTNNSTLTPAHVYPSNSLSYIATLIVMTDCGLADTIAFALSDVIGIQEAEKLGLQVFPNPADDRLVLTSEEKELQAEDFRWFDSSGKQCQVALLYADKRRLEFDVSGLSSGEYLILLNDGRAGVLKVMIR